MAVEGSQPFKISMVASGDLSASQYLFVKQDATGLCAVVTAATDIVVGVLQNKPKAAGQMAEIVVIGRTKLVAVGAIAVGAHLGPDSAGKAQTVTLQGYGGGYVQATKKSVGQLHQGAASSASDVITALVDCVNPAPAT